MARQSITLTSPNDQWLQAQVESDEYGSKSEVVNDLIRQARRRQEATESLRSALITGENSGTSNDTVDDIRDRVLARRVKHG
ncbi:type II toxin-antitoxin system ParD family antitoxin [Endozoicomonas sp. GU-1]|uniref:type II toxin-antitoxin system ParD family antitoxin n=1 Tax=Endozoicomonas sp. GU-1 TaxID=3009078 RepID=UPI0022B36EFD|nr:type II toxin-antitoxin system ParD family antitoxin [Endozoicomonas sp. GU-1]WBA79763.1 type II toxin-antitoxin system ParD family antitoxin [Endozoicomonas sp. GU-1]WBA87345.1 type II toxin-antitoxin system ParD family antitoxin [Endozoicomonas sp. GU-1]